MVMDLETMEALDPATVLIVGDTHGNTGVWKFKHRQAWIKTGAKVVIQVGDFGLWPGGEKYIRKVSQYAREDGVHIFWLDGNHENFDELQEMEALGASEPFSLSDNLHYLPRGFAWSWSGKRMMAMGGAYSVDKTYRSPHQSWWPQEEITDDDVLRGLAQGRVDVIFSHDAPDGVMVPGVHAERKQRDFPASFPNRERLFTVMASAKPEILFHGHYHVSYINPRWQYGGEGTKPVDIVGLNMENNMGSQVVLRFPSLDWHRP